MSRPLAAVIQDQERVFAELLEAERQLERLSRAGRPLGIVDGQSTDTDEALAALHAAQHRLEALDAEALEAALAPLG